MNLFARAILSGIAVFYTIELAQSAIAKNKAAANRDNAMTAKLLNDAINNK